MLSSRPDTATQKKPPTPGSHQPHFQHQLRLSPSRLSSEPLSLVSKPVPVTSASPKAVSPVTQSSKCQEKVSPPASATPGNDHKADSEPLSLVNKTPESPENLIKKPSETDKSQMMSPAPTRPEVSSIRVRPAEALSPLCQPPLKKARQSPSPRLVSGSQKPPESTASSPKLIPPPLLPHFPPTYLPPTSAGYRPGLPPTSTPSLPPSSIPGLPPTSVPGLPPNPLASLYSPYSPYLSALAGHPAPPGAPGAEALWAAQAAHLMALGGLNPAGYPNYPPGLHAYPPSMMPPSFPGAPAPSLPGLLPPHLLAPPPHSGPAPPASATPPTSLPLTVGGASQFMCSWMQGRDYCGRRFNSSEELMSHLRTHTANMGDTAPAPSSSPAPPPAPAPSSALALLQAQAAQLRGPVSPGQSAPPPPSSLSPPSIPDPRLYPYLRPGLPQAPHPSLSPVLASLYGAPRQLPVLP